jgi:predicted metalloprotease
VGIRFDNSRVDTSGVSDRRGRGGVGGPVAVGGGGIGVVGLVVYLLITMLGGGGGDASGLFPESGMVQADDESATGDLETRCNTEGAIDAYDDCFLVKVYNELNEVWTAQLGATQYEQPGLTFYTQGVRTGCGPASSDVGPFYCPADRSVYIDIGFLEALQRRFGADGRYAQAYIMAHETGHHLQTLLGTERDVRRQQQAAPSKENRLSVALELQADCYAGVWSKLADDAGNVSVGDAEVTEAQNAAAAVGDDRIQQKSGGRVDPESWTHGSAEQRRQWFTTGRQAGDPAACDTFDRT